MRLNKIYNQLKNYTNQLLENKKKKFILDLKIIFCIFNKGFTFLLCVIDILSKYAWVVPLKDKTGVSFANAFQEILDKSGRKPNKIWVDT